MKLYELLRLSKKKASHTGLVEFSTPTWVVGRGDEVLEEGGGAERDEAEFIGRSDFYRYISAK